MQKALIIVNNKNSANNKFGESIAQFLLHRGLIAELIPINNFEPRKLEEVDYLLLSGWKNRALFSISQPDSEWINFVNKLPNLDGMQTAIFNVSKLFSGRMFKRMKKYLNGKKDNIDFAFKSSDGSLSISDKLTLNEFIG
ncbi:MAG: hypothetical protein HND40_13015 [Ignavibacteriota bacterium]|nr:hypothetical protein [Ignavibacteriota bacterium]MBW7842103.1 hypothetical protein [Ignavibacterium sp.]MCO6446469.1 hypothetical protein [Ignavibacterium album]MCZ2269715.1 hypothetical protein [Ignavibacteriales bacterium]HMN17051.1 hypothetical protein [Ignavibacteriaceae bacterium]